VRPQRALFGICKECDGPDVEERLIERIGAVRATIN
jgi:hypothetical protein